ncbi:sugar nucleotide-binding protein [Candidatus Leptofilum sp.]|uniref:sugar nucleotide-binding protein n=1 Tax=Candidatus Leptofilum sp. TaxID=3241576 RepID=UPI003B59037F
MKALITGMNGAVGTALNEYLLADGHLVVGWDRTAVSPNDLPAAKQFLQATQPDVLFHLAIASQSTGQANEGWRINVEWPTQLAQLCHEQNIRFVFTSSVMVFTDDAVGPFTPESVPDAREGYGYDKLMAEQQVRAANPEAIIVRLGWQIGDAPGSNNMVDFLAKQEVVRASEKWLPACSFLVDTAVALQTLAHATPDLYLLDSNSRWNFYQIATALNELHGNQWRIEKTADFIYDQRMRDPRADMPSLDKRLSSLA